MNGLFIRLYLDEDVSVRVGKILNSRGYDVQTTRDAGRLGTSDPEQLAFAAEQGVPAMKIKYFPQTDTLHIELRDADITETRDIDENTQIDVDARGVMCGITIEHASQSRMMPECPS